MTRLLRYARQSDQALAENQLHNLAARQALVHYPSGAVYSFIPKNACTTLRYSLALANGCIAGPDDFTWVHANNSTFVATLRDLVTAPYTFTILRCPHARLASAFLDKIVGRKRDAWKLRRGARDTFELDDLTFRGFCDLLSARQLRMANIHWRPQIDFLVYQDYDDWFRLEAFAEAAEKIEARTGLKIHDARVLSRHVTDLPGLEPGDGFADCPVHELAAMRRAGRAPAHKALYDEELADKVAGWYAADLALYRDRFGPEGLLVSDGLDMWPLGRGDP